MILAAIVMDLPAIVMVSSAAEISASGPDQPVTMLLKLALPLRTSATLRFLVPASDLPASPVELRRITHPSGR